MSTPKSGVQVILSKDGTDLTAYTDNNGKATFNSVLIGQYTATIVMPNGYSFAVGNVENNISDSNSSNNNVSTLPYTGIDVANAATSTGKIIIKTQNTEIHLYLSGYISTYSGKFRIRTIDNSPVTLATTFVFKFGTTVAGVNVVNSDADFNWIGGEVTFTIPAGDYRSSEQTIDFNGGNGEFGWVQLVSKSNPNMVCRSHEDSQQMIATGGHVLPVGTWKILIDSLHH